MATTITASRDITAHNQEAEQHYLPIYNKDAEQAVIGSLLLDNAIIERLDFLRAEHFYMPLNSELFSKIKKAHDNLFAVTRDTVIEGFTSGKDEEETQNISNHINNCFASASWALNPEGVARQIIDMYSKRQLIEASKRTINDVTFEKRDEHSDMLIEEAEHRIFLIAQDGGYKKEFESFDSLVGKSVDAIESNYKNQKSILGLTTGFIDLDKLLGGMQRSDLLILAARPSMGKTALAINIAMNAAEVISKNDEAIGFFSLEMSAEQLTNRIISMRTGINSFDLRSGRINQNQFDSIMHQHKELSQLQLFIDDTAGIAVSSLCSRARRLAGKHKLRAIFIDYLQLLRGNQGSRHDNRVNEVSAITQELKGLAKEIDVPVIALSQLSRAVEQRDDKRPLLSDLRDSGSIEQDADVVMFIYREEYYTRRSQPKEGTEEHIKWQKTMNETMNQAEIILAKQRNGPIGNIKLYYDSSTTIFHNAK